MIITFLALAVLGAVLIASGCFLLWGIGVSLLASGAMCIIAAIVIARGVALNDQTIS